MSANSTYPRDRRTDCRYLADGECTVRYKVGRNFIETPAWISDVSVRGLRLAVGQTVPIGTAVAITLDVAPSDPVYGQVVRASSSPVSGHFIGVAIAQGTIPFTVFQKLVRDSEAAAPSNHTPACLLALGLSYPSTRKEVHAAFRRLSLKAHPDHGGDAKEFIALYAAYQDAMKLCTT